MLFNVTAGPPALELLDHDCVILEVYAVPAVAFSGCSGRSQRRAQS
jgi:hypothetical protein